MILARQAGLAPACLVAIIASLLLLATPRARADHGPAGSAQASLTLSRQEADYGSDSTETVTELSAALRYWWGAGDMRITMPHVWLTVEAADGTRIAASGQGDLRFDARMLLAPAQDARPTVRLLGGIKLPTADEGEGLGTGEADVTAGLGIDAFLTEAVFWFADADYTLVGQPAGEPLNDQWRAAVGGGGYLGPALVLTAALEQRTAIYPGAPDPREAIVGAAWLAPVGWHATLSAGLSDGAPDYGLSFGVHASL